MGRTEVSIRGVFFDLDETLVSYEAAEDAGLAASAALLPGVGLSELRRAVVDAYLTEFGPGTTGFWELATLPTRLLRERVTGLALERLGLPGDVGALVDRHEAACHEAMFVFPEVVDVLAALAPHVMLGLISNGPGPMQREKLGRFGLTEYFSVIAIDSEVGFSKPDARIFEWAARRADLSAAELLFVGNDLEVDVRGAENAGWKSCCIYRPGSCVERVDDVDGIATLNEILARVMRPR